MRFLDKKNYELLGKIIIVVFAIYVMINVVSTQPSRTGDGEEYMLMTQAFQNHGTPYVLDSDVLVASESYNYKFNIPEGRALQFGFFESYSQKQYSYHFWLYSLIVMPMKIILETVGIDSFNAFQYTNAIMYLCMLIYVYRKTILQEQKKFILIILLVFNPAIYYIRWTHPEIFTFCLACISLTMFYNKEYARSILIISIASMQNPPIIFLGGMYFVKYLFEEYKIEGLKIKKIIKVWINFIPFFIPFIFYYVNFGTLSLIVSTGFIDIGGIYKKAIGILFDLNQGMVTFEPIQLIMFISIMLYGLFKRDIDSWLNCVTLIIILSVCATQVNYNSDSSGMNRYIVWINPLIIYYIVNSFKLFSDSKKRNALECIVIFSSIITIGTILLTGGYTYKYSYVEHNPVAKFVLDKYPNLYNPPSELFAERTIHKEGNFYDDLPIIYRNNEDIITKVLLSEEYLSEFLETIDYNHEGLMISKKGKHEKELFYLNFKEELNIRTKKQPIINAEDRKYALVCKDIKPRLDKNKYYQLNMELTNKGNQIFYKHSNMNDGEIAISYHWLDRISGEYIIWDGIRTFLPKTVKPNETIELSMGLQTPEKSGKYVLVIDLIQENVAWFSNGSNSYEFEINVE